MEQIGNMKLYSLEEITSEFIGKKGTKERAKFDNEVDEALHAYKIGKAIKENRVKQNMTQAELGERVGVQKSQISRIENGSSISLLTMSRVFKALGIANATLDLGIGGKIALW